MKINSSYPYPVLHRNNDDYINSKFQVKYETTQEFGELKINAIIELINEGINELILNKAAKFLLHIECPQTSYRNAFGTDNYDFNISIETNYLRGKIYVHSFIIVENDITNYTNQLLSDWYKGMNIKYMKGNILGIGDAIEIILHEDNTDLMDLPSIIDIHRGIDKEYMEVDVYSNNIIISLPSHEYDLYANYANTMLKNTIISMVILPCLTYVFSKVKENSEDIKEYAWYQVMERLFKDNNYRLEDIGNDNLTPLKAAQLVLHKPLKTSFKEIEKKLNNLED